MTGNLILRLERLEQIERDQPKPGPLAALSDDELTVNLLETCAAIMASDCAPEDQAEARETAARIRSDIEGWAAFWRGGGWGDQASEAEPLRPLTGNSIGETERERAKRGEMHYRARAALESIGACNGGQHERLVR